MTLPLSDTLEELALCCEQATGPDRKLDDAIVTDVFGWERRQLGGVIPWFDRDGEMHAAAPRYTASIDAAGSLVPVGEGRWPQQCYTGPNPNNGEQGHRVDLWLSGSVKVRGRSRHHYALALCAASLRARSAMEARGTETPNG
jgi:hypothetical protein